MKVARYWGHSFVPALLRRDGTAFDFGANNGGFSRRISPLCAHVYAYEPTLAARGRLDLPDNVTMIEQAVAAREGRMRFFVNSDRRASAHFAEPGAAAAEVEAVTLADAFEREPSGVIDLVKMDIEGEEIAVLAQAEPEILARVAQISVEFHDFLDPSTRTAVRRVVARLETLGFFAVRMSWRTYGDMLFINRKLVPLSFADRLRLRYAHRYRAGLARIARRVFAPVFGGRG